MDMLLHHTLGLIVIIVLVLVLPFSIKKIEEELEVFLFLMGICAVSLTGSWNMHLLEESIKEPAMISIAVLVLGLMFNKFRQKLKQWIEFLLDKYGLKKTLCLLVFVLGIISSGITAIVAALVLSEVAKLMNLKRQYELKFVIYGCYAIGLGAILTPIGEPLATITIAKLKAPPHNADFFYLLRLLWMWVIPGVILMSLLITTIPKNAFNKSKTDALEPETSASIFTRAGKVYLFIMALVFLGEGFKPMAEITVAKLPDPAIYWINTISAVLDNATLAAAEIVPSMSKEKIVFLTMGLIVSGGLLIPGNIPNIICASKLNIKSREWAKVGVPIGLVLLLVYFILLMIPWGG